VTDRGQLVLVAAAVVAVALAPVVLAYLQLGAHPDVAASGEYDAPGANAERFLERAVHEAGTNATDEHAWSAREQAVASTRRDLAPRLDRLRSTRVEQGTAYRVAYNDTAAGAWAQDDCPDGPDRQFGPCETDRGVVVQERAGTTHVLGVAFDVRVTTERRRTNLTLVVRTVSR